MDSWKIMAAAITVSISAQAFAEDKGSYQNSMFLVLLAPTVTVAATTGLTMLAANNFKPAKADALAFIGSEGEIRGAQFEQASRYYRSTYSSPLMSDMQLAQAIATSY
ncbi:DUF2388 domain-containing protein [Pseudomonas fluorescens]|uniref:DUF2388 domain-containing protein n=1 Tax=Pseudomonas fluorescens TaxID=294 RepID=UPI0017818792|nr:DUF2388 domain-containing protein [Pseudomonas fluorescens]MBD8194379.1 DUF2388 domain-containing protein [Pseudomonas fluorescens]MBD8229186.1 DUF2388 domain-containing protein [Pseudomonas fluorescens]MBD8787189.1 DUF2388 domain-containing protein [Pseudomonas fluorescens]MBD8819541.1 DUF2388 domain-containing protein [Pseudomonas fluorescens]